MRILDQDNDEARDSVILYLTGLKLENFETRWGFCSSIQPTLMSTSRARAIRKRSRFASTTSRTWASSMSAPSGSLKLIDSPDVGY